MLNFFYDGVFLWKDVIVFIVIKLCQMFVVLEMQCVFKFFLCLFLIFYEGDFDVINDFRDVLMVLFFDINVLLFSNDVRLIDFVNVIGILSCFKEDLVFKVGICFGI